MEVINDNDVLNLKGVSKSKAILKTIDQMVLDHDVTYIDAVVDYCEKNDVEIESVASIIKSNQKFKAKLEDDAISLNFLPRGGKLPLDND